MAIGDPDLNLLVALRALLEEANVTRAGERIGMGQSTMSSALARLRTVFQDELLVRIGRDYELTPLAHQLLPQVQLTLPLVAQALGQKEPFQPELTQRRFGIQLTDYAAIELRPVFGIVVAAGDGLAFDLRRLPTEPTAAGRDLLSNDFIVTVPGIGIEAPSFELFRDEYVVVADRDNPLVADGSITLEDFLASPHIRCDFGRAHLTPAERRMRELDLRPEVRVATSTLLSIPPIVIGTDLIGVVPRRLVERSGTTTVAVPTPFPTVELVERLWWHPAHGHDPAHAWFRDTIAAVVGSGALGTAP
ncbi:LysR family transcriptional regulator [Leucobacter weissii]|uniref:LysR family transcriptional regulator n=1 Tax=Leucobacter weissii TaxID=1983706 RepID=A0A939S917_9MICO|nr:LysR family transcriptional regulator [Leucobacter weissii]MBO1902681.1 LysR family transcriptional regulator [Leucobacter weissii]